MPVNGSPDSISFCWCEFLFLVMMSPAFENSLSLDTDMAGRGVLLSPARGMHGDSMPANCKGLSSVQSTDCRRSFPSHAHTPARPAVKVCSRC